MSNRFTQYILIAMALGIAMGTLVFNYLPDSRVEIAADAPYIVTAADHEQSYQTLADGKADAFATDDILLYGLIARHKAQDRFRVTGEYLSYDPYGIMFRKGEPQLSAVVERAFRKLGSNRDLVPLYNKWFVSRLPTGEKLNVAISPQLEEAFKVLDDSAGANN